MTQAGLKVTFAGPLVSLQDAGRAGGLRYGVSPSGPMDRLAFAAAHAALGNPAGGTAIEVSLGGLSVTCADAPVTLAITGGDFVVDLNGVTSGSWQVMTLLPNDRLTIRAGATGSWAYVAVAGEIAAKTWMGSTAHHSMTHLGADAIASGTTITIDDAQVRSNRIGNLAPPVQDTNDNVRVVMGPQDHHFNPTSVETFLGSHYKVAPAYDRMGMRLDGETLDLLGALSIPSEPVLRGAVQVAGNGVPTVLLADHQSTGGYPKIATVLACDTDRLTQFRAGDPVSFTAILPEEAIKIARNAAQNQIEYLETLNVIRGSLEERLMRENLIHGHLPED